MALYVHFCADFKKYTIPDYLHFQLQGGFKTKMIYAGLFYLHGETICSIWSKLRDKEWKGLKKSCFTETAPLLVQPGNLCPSLQVCWYKLLGCVLLGVSITSKKGEGWLLFQMYNNRSQSPLHVLVNRVENALNYEEFCPRRSTTDQALLQGD